jgi:DHA1 family tetracycline resistance protein-like MFS transporter
MPVPRKAAVHFIFITLLIDVMGWGVIIPVMPKLVSQLKGISINAASPYGAWLLFAYAATQFVCSPIVGNLSDRYGRRPVLLCSLAGFAIDYLFMALAPTYGLLFIGRVIAGITGASFTTGAAYIADVSTPETRVKNFGLIGAAFGLGFMIGPLIGGIMGNYWGPRAPFYAAAILCSLNWLYGYFYFTRIIRQGSSPSFRMEESKPFWFIKIFKNPFFHCRACSLLFFNLSRRDGCTGQLELFYHVPLSLDSRPGWLFFRSSWLDGGYCPGCTYKKN